MKKQNRIFRLSMLLVAALAFLPLAQAATPHLLRSNSGVPDTLEPTPFIEPLAPQTLPTTFNGGGNIILATAYTPAYQNVAEMIVGRVPGVMVRGTGYWNYQIRIRGAMGPPLVVLDGMPFNGYDDEQVNNLLWMIPVPDVESIEIIKSPAQAAVYGAGAANGVIVIRTKQGGAVEE